jgi:FemAB-related protein (PEP-CTERM system-associated)
MTHVRECTAAAETWDAYVRAAPHSTFCHLAGWREIMSDVLGHEFFSLVARDDAGTWQGVLPFVRVKSPLFGHFLVSMPFLNAGGAIGGEHAVAALLDWSLVEARRSGADLLELRSRIPVSGGLRRSDRKITVHRVLPPDWESLWKSFPAKLRSQIRRPQKEGFDVRFGLDQREAFYDVFSRDMRSLGTPVLPGALFERIATVFPREVEFGVVYRGEQPIAAGCGFVWRNEFEMVWASSLREYRRQAPNMLLYWSFMQRMIARGIGVFDFGRCTPGGNTHAFKRQWGGTDVGLPWAQWSRGEVTATPSPARPIFRAAAACWRHLPLAVANRLGPMIAARIP